MASNPIGLVGAEDYSSQQCTTPSATHNGTRLLGRLSITLSSNDDVIKNHSTFQWNRIRSVYDAS